LLTEKFEARRLIRVAGDLRLGVERLVRLAPQAGCVGARALEHGHDDPAVLLEQSEQQVLWSHLRVAARLRDSAGRLRMPLGP